MFAELFQPTPDENDERDPSTRAGVLRIKAKIEGVWAARGYDVADEIKVVEVGFTKEMRGKHHALRSPGFINGMPPQTCKQESAQ